MDEQMKKYSIFIHIQCIYIQYTYTHDGLLFSHEKERNLATVTTWMDWRALR